MLYTSLERYFYRAASVFELKSVDQWGRNHKLKVGSFYIS